MDWININDSSSYSLWFVIFSSISPHAVGGSKLFQRWRSAPSTTSQNIFEEKRTRYRHNTGEGGKGWFASVDRLLKSLFVSNKKKS